VEEEPLIYRDEVRAIMIALADLVHDVRAIRDWLEGSDGEEEGNAAGED
jgi:hypothetical protein